VLFTIQIGVQRVHNAQNAQRKEVCVHSVQSARLWTRKSMHFLSHVGGNFSSEILLLQLRSFPLVGWARLVLVPTRKID
jgi:hypothetical protein